MRVSVFTEYLKMAVSAQQRAKHVLCFTCMICEQMDLKLNLLKWRLYSHEMFNVTERVNTHKAREISLRFSRSSQRTGGGGGNKYPMSVCYVYEIVDTVLLLISWVWLTADFSLILIRFRIESVCVRVYTYTIGFSVFHF
jgi:hypothetical protein